MELSTKDNQKRIIEKTIKFYVIDAVKWLPVKQEWAEEFNTIMQT
jgi:hypothetical protein